LHALRGFEITVVCLSYGERGESAKLWREPGMSLQAVKDARRAEAEAAAKVLGAHAIEFYDLGDYPLRPDDAALYRLVDLYRRVRPSFVVTHSLSDPYNADHAVASQFAQEARVIAQAHGHKPGETVLGAPPVFLFEPHQPEQCDWKPNLLLDISEVWETKRAAIECMRGQEYLWEYYTRVGQQRGVQAARNSDRKVTHSEGYQRIFPQVAEALA